MWKKDCIIPNFKLLNRGRGINGYTHDVLIHASYEALKAREDPLSNGILKSIQSKMLEDWLVFAFVNGLKGFDYTVSGIRDSGSIDFLIDGFMFQIYKIWRNL